MNGSIAKSISGNNGTSVRRRPRGEKSRSAILLAATQLATVRGLDGLSIGDLAAHLGMSKSGLYAHFKSKEELQLATISTAAEIFDREVLRPASATSEGIPRLIALAEKFLSHLKRRVFPGGCFFAAVAAEMGMRPGAVRDRVVEIQQGWMSLLDQCVRHAQQHGKLDSSANPSQIVFEVEAMLVAANMLFVLSGGDSKFLTQARKGIDHVLDAFSP